MLKAAIYARVSTDDKGQDTANQTTPLASYAERRGWPVVHVYTEEESAWKGGHQKELSRALEDARRGRFNVLLVWSLDRVSREGPLAILKLVDRLGRYRCQIISLQESWTEAPGELFPLLLALAGWVAEQESKRRSERTKAGLARVRATGKHIGRPSLADYVACVKCGGCFPPSHFDTEGHKKGQTLLATIEPLLVRYRAGELSLKALARDTGLPRKGLTRLVEGATIAAIKQGGK